MSALVASIMTLSFVACGTAASSRTRANATVTGRVTAGPTCPVERVGHPCPPAPVAATVQAKTSRGRVAASTHTDANGRYSLHLPSGSYTLVAVTSKPLPRCSPVKVSVKANRSTRAAISCDSGIR